MFTSKSCRGAHVLDGQVEVEDVGVPYSHSVLNPGTPLYRHLCLHFSGGSVPFNLNDCKLKQHMDRIKLHQAEQPARDCLLQPTKPSRRTAHMLSISYIIYDLTDHR